MTKSVFKRFLFYSMTVTFICTLVICGIATVPMSRYIEKSRRSAIEENSQNVAAFVGEMTKDDINVLSEKEGEVFAESLEVLSESLNAVLAVVDTEGKIIYSSTSELSQGDITLSQEIMGMISDGEHFEHGNLHNIYDSTYYISAVPITADNNGLDVLGYCLFAQSNVWSTEYVPNAIGLLILTILVAFVLVFIMSAVYAYNTTIPLKQMAAAAKRFAIGDFESRGNIKTNDEIGELSAAFNEMADSLASSEGMRRNFIANVSHELKTPMTTIAGYIDGILDGTIPEDDREHYLGIISQEIKRLNRLVTSMISLSKIDSGEIKVTKAPFVIQDTVFNVLLGFESEIEKLKLNIEGLDDEDDITAFGDKDLIHQVLYNLVENAVKFTNEGGYIRFGFTHKNNRVYVYVENSGEGILPEDLRLVFDKFYKGDKSRSRNKKSMGLGLYIVRTIINLHGGKITVESEPGEFCRFMFYIPDAPKKQKELPDIIKEV